MTHPPFRPLSASHAFLVATICGVALVLALALPFGRGTVEAAPAPSITAVSPSTGPSAGGTVVTISGSGFIAGASVTFGGVATSSITIVSATQITATTPAGAPGVVVVAVTNPDGQGTTLSGGYIYQFAPPTLSNIAPASGTSAGGTAVTLTGTGFRAGASVTLGSNAATAVVVVNGTTITATTPSNLVGAANVTIANSDGQSATLAAGYTYTAAPTPTITSVAPPTGTAAGGTSVTITGTGFVSGATVLFDGIAATAANVTNATTMTATTPVHASGVVSIVVVNPDTQSGAMSGGYTYNPLPAPTVTSISPATGPGAGGTAVTIAGTGFVTGATVTIGTSALNNVSVVSPTSITGTTPARSAGFGAVRVTNPDGQSGTLGSGGFTSAANAVPTVATITPSSGSTTGGTSISITGTGFIAGATVQIGGVAATTISVSPTVITAITPAHSAAAVPVTVTNYDGQSGSNVTGFTYKANAAPTIATVAPVTGTMVGGTVVTITGTGFTAGATVSFGPFSGTNVIIGGGTSIIVTTPAGTMGEVPVIVTNTDGQVAILSAGFKYQAAPATVTAVVPGTGPTAGGTPVTILGTNFATGATVTFGGAPATNIVISSSQSISATTPAATAAALVDVVVTNPNASPGTLTGGFAYGGATAAGPGPQVASTPPVGGMTFVLSGTNDLKALIGAQNFPVVSAYTLDVAKQVWSIYVAGAPVNSLTSLSPTDIVVLRR